MSTQTTWEYFGLPPEMDGRDVVAATASRNGHRTATTAVRRRWRRRPDRERAPQDRAVTWLRNAMVALGALAIAAAVVSFAAQFHMVYAYRGQRAIAALEAAIPDAAALVFASLGIALALHGRRAVRARMLNVGAVATSVFMNFAAAAPGWRGLAIWIMPPIAYALASDTAIGVIRSWAIARARELREDLADDEATPLAILGGLCLWLLRLTLAPPSTIAGFRRWVLEECPVAPGRTAQLPPANVAASPAALPPGGAATATAWPSGGRHGGGQRRGSGRDWDALTDATRQRYIGAGIDREAYEGGADLSAARGHRDGAS
jgi:hypothetical protein